MMAIPRNHYPSDRNQDHRVMRCQSSIHGSIHEELYRDQQ